MSPEHEWKPTSKKTNQTEVLLAICKIVKELEEDLARFNRAFEFLRAIHIRTLRNAQADLNVQLKDKWPYVNVGEFKSMAWG